MRPLPSDNLPTALEAFPHPCSFDHQGTLEAPSLVTVAYRRILAASLSPARP